MQDKILIPNLTSSDCDTVCVECLEFVPKNDKMTRI